MSVSYCITLPVFPPVTVCRMETITDLIAQAKAMQSCLSVKMEDTALALQQQQQEQQ